MSAPDLINALIGKPYAKGARGPDAFDCWGLVLAVLRCLRPGQAMPDWANANMSRARQRALMRVNAPCYCVPLDAPAEGCLLISERIGHIGILVQGRVIHARSGVGVISTKLGQFLAEVPGVRCYAWRG